MCIRDRENAAFGKPMHNAGVVFNEEILVKGAAMYAYGALKWLAEGRKANEMCIRDSQRTPAAGMTAAT